ncbi:MAG: histidine phosphatase family protein [Anaerolineales bacterium]|nr:histidine phosphatase family protein [Anaerolineales bacterium]
MTSLILVRHGQTAWNREERFRGHANVFEFDHDQFTLTLLNETSHLLQVEAKQAASAESRTI